jgi:AAA family ATP:ADP antiporter
VDHPGLVERALRLVTVVHPHEVTTALLMTLNGFLLLAAYAAIKPVREALILAHPGGAQYKVYMGGATAIILMAAVPVYGRVSRNLRRNALVVAVTLFFASHLVLFYLLGSGPGSSLSLALGFYLWIAVFNMMIVAQYWAYANDLYGEDAGQRLFPLFGLGASLGAVAGAGATSAVIARVGPLSMMLLAAVLLVGSAGVTQWIHLREVRRATSSALRAAAERVIGGSAADGFRLVFSQRYLALIAVFSLIFTLVKTNGDYLLAATVQRASASAVSAGALAPHDVERYVGSFFAGYDFRVDVLSLAIQAFVVSRLVGRAGVGRAFLVLPVVAFGDAAIMLLFPALAAVSAGKTAESAVDYSLNNTLRGMLWLPTGRREKYLAKQATDTFFVRLGDVTSALLVFAGTHALGLPLRGFAAVNVALVGAWLALALGIGRERARLLQAKETHSTSAPSSVQP